MPTVVTLVWARLSCVYVYAASMRRALSETEPSAPKGVPVAEIGTASPKAREVPSVLVSVAPGRARSSVSTLTGASAVAVVSVSAVFEASASGVSVLAVSVLAVSVLGTSVLGTSVLGAVLVAEPPARGVSVPAAVAGLVTLPLVLGAGRVVFPETASGVGSAKRRQFP